MLEGSSFLLLRFNNLNKVFLQNEIHYFQFSLCKTLFQKKTLVTIPQHLTSILLTYCKSFIIKLPKGLLQLFYLISCSVAVF